MELGPLRDTLSRLPAGVTLVATRTPGGFRAITATSFTPVSLEPPLVLVCVDRLTQTRDAIVAEGRFTASLLGKAQQFLADRFAGRAPVPDPAWGDVPHRQGFNGLPIVVGAVAWFECRVENVYPAGDHDILLAAVTAAGEDRGDPLIHWQRGYWSLQPG